MAEVFVLLIGPAFRTYICEHLAANPRESPDAGRGMAVHFTPEQEARIAQEARFLAAGHGEFIEDQEMDARLKRMFKH